MLTRSLRLNPKQSSALYHRIFLRQKQCAWPIYDPLPGNTLEDQMAAWNRGDLAGYMAGYAKIDTLVFTSGGKVRTGWQAMTSQQP